MLTSSLVSIYQAQKLPLKFTIMSLRISSPKPKELIIKKSQSNKPCGCSSPHCKIPSGFCPS